MEYDVDLSTLDDDEFVALTEHVVAELHRRFEEVNINLRVKKKGKTWQQILAQDSSEDICCLKK